MSKLKKHILILIILVLAACTRLLFLNNVPNSTNFDQLHYILDTKSFFVTGKDITGTVTPLDILFFHYPKGQFVQAELPYFLEYVFVGLFPLTLATVVLPYALLSIGTVLLMYLLGKKLWNNKVGLIAAALACINPWLLFLGRTSFEVGAATFFYLLTFYLFMTLKGWRLIIILPIMMLAFYSYIGTKLIFAPFILVCILYSYYEINKRRFTSQYLILGAFAVVITGVFLFQLHTQPGLSRTSEIFTPQNAALAKEVDTVRKLSLVSPLTPIFENKYTMYLRMIVQYTFNLFSPTYLFASGDFFFSIYRHGLFYVLDAVFLLFGIATFFTKNKKLSMLFLSLIILSILPQILHNSAANGNFSPHIGLLVPLLLFIIAYGIAEITKKGTTTRYLMTAGIILCYCFLFVNFLSIYFFQSPLNKGMFTFENRLLDRYLSLAKSNTRPIIVHVNDPEFSLKEYAFYTDEYEKNNVSKINALIKTKNYTVDNIHFIPCDTPESGASTSIIIYQAICGKKLPGHPVNIPLITDSGSAYAIYHDTLCQADSLRPFLPQLHLSDMNVEASDKNNFCHTFVLYY